jgi:hypothetical protein
MFSNQTIGLAPPGIGGVLTKQEDEVIIHVTYVSGDVSLPGSVENEHNEKV